MNEREQFKTKVIPFKEWENLGIKLFGEKRRNWKFKCVSCGEIQSGEDFIKAKVKDPQLYPHFSCIGRFVKGRGCDWTLGGLLTIQKLEVITEDGKTTPVFEFADKI